MSGNFLNVIWDYTKPIVFGTIGAVVIAGIFWLLMSCFDSISAWLVIIAIVFEAAIVKFTLPRHGVFGAIIGGIFCLGSCILLFYVFDFIGCQFADDSWAIVSLIMSPIIGAMVGYNEP